MARLGVFMCARPRDHVTRRATGPEAMVPETASNQGLDSVSSMVEDASTMEETVSDLNQRIAARVRELRAARGLSLDALAARSGVSRSMISLIERGESSATAVVLEKLAGGLEVSLASLFDAPAAMTPARGGPLSRR